MAVRDRLARDYRSIALTIVSWFWIVVPGPAFAAPMIEWRLENPFRLFGAPELTEMHAKALASLTEEERKTPILSVERKLSASFQRGWASNIFRKDGILTCYNPQSDTYGDIPSASPHHAACKDYVLPAAHRVVFTLKDPPIGTAACKWTVAFPGRASKSSASDCTGSVTLEVPYKLVGNKAVPSQVSVAVDDAIVATTAVAVRDALIVGLGDSFGSGEGNPDLPIEFNDARSLNYGNVGGISLDGRPARVGAYPSWTDFVRLEGNPGFYDNRERWWDRQCHRSLYSHQVRVALELSLEDPHRAVTYVSFSCSGSEVINGLISRKATVDCTPNLGDNVASGADLPAQVSALAGALCVPEKLRRDQPIPAVMTRRNPSSPPFSFLPSDEQGTDWKKIDRCDKTNGEPTLKRPIDLVLLSIGGNDIGFSGVVADAILEPNTPYRKMALQFGVIKTEASARKALLQMADKYFVTFAALKFLFGVGAAKQPNVILTGYPQMAYSKPGQFCSGTGGLETFPNFKYEPAKVRTAEEVIVPGLLKVMREAAKANGWQYVDSFRSCAGGHDCFENHGVCSVGDGAGEQFGFPIRQASAWEPYSPSAYRPYQTRQRWFRSPNDAFLTSNSHTRALAAAQCKSNLTSLGVGSARLRSSFQAFFASSYGGAFHPNAEGQAAIADAALIPARKVLASRGK